MTGWIKFHREIITSPFWLNATAVQRVIAATLMCMASRTGNQWVFKGEVYNIKPGQMVTSVQSIIERCNCKEITRQKVRTALEYLKKCGFLTYETTNQNTFITILNWENSQGYYVEYNQPNNQGATNDQPTTNQGITTIKNNKNNNNYKNYKNSGYSENIKNAFNNYEQEKYSYEEMEELLNNKMKAENFD